MANEKTARGLADRLAGKTKEVAGAVLRKPELRQEGELHQQEARAEDDAAKADLAAQQREAEADIVTKEQELKVERKRLDAEVAQENDVERIDRERRTNEARN